MGHAPFVQCSVRFSGPTTHPQAPYVICLWSLTSNNGPARSTNVQTYIRTDSWRRMSHHRHAPSWCSQQASNRRSDQRHLQNAIDKIQLKKWRKKIFFPVPRIKSNRFSNVGKSVGSLWKVLSIEGGQLIGQNASQATPLLGPPPISANLRRRRHGEPTGTEILRPDGLAGVSGRRYLFIEHFSFFSLCRVTNQKPTSPPRGSSQSQEKNFTTLTFFLSSLFPRAAGNFSYLHFFVATSTDYCPCATHVTNRKIISNPIFPSCSSLGTNVDLLNIAGNLLSCFWAIIFFRNPDFICK